MAHFADGQFGKYEGIANNIKILKVNLTKRYLSLAYFM